MTQKREPKAKPTRLDQYLTAHHSLELRQATGLIMTGKVLVNDQKITKPGHPVSAQDIITLLDSPSHYVSRGALKLKGAHDAFKFTIHGQHVLDIGISTGGFTDYCLQNGATSVIGVDVGYGQVEGALQHHPNLLILERTNARYLTKDLLINTLNHHQKPLTWADIQLVVMDVSFISVTKILPAIKDLCQPDCQFIIMIKPQFEATKEELPHGGIIQTGPLRTAIIHRTITTLIDMGFHLTAQCPSSLVGTKGNMEEFIGLTLMSPETSQPHTNLNR